MKKSIFILLLTMFSLNLVLAAQSPSIWITKDSCNTKESAQNTLEFPDHIFINAEGFGALNQARPYKIEGSNASCNPLEVIASGNITFDSQGKGCVDAYIVNQNNCGEYKVYIGPRYINITIRDFEPPVVPEFNILLIPVIFISSIFAYLLIRR